MEAVGDLIRNKIVDEITRVSKTFPKSNSKTNDAETIREKYISPELRQKIIDNFRFKDKNFLIT